MFNIETRPEFTRTVKVQVPEGEAVREYDFRATFVWLPSDELEEFDNRTTEGIKDMLRAVIVRCDDLLGKGDKPVEWSDGVREQLLGWSNSRLALLLAYNSAWTEEKRGN